MSYYKVATVADLPASGGLPIELGRDRIAIFRCGPDGAQYFAINDLCPHRGAPLSEGYLESDKVFCPWHCFDFNLRTGESTIATHLCVTTYPVQVDEDEAIWILYPDELIDVKEGGVLSDDL
jgi:nitrite reductase (NADH) small subunit